MTALKAFGHGVGLSLRKSKLLVYLWVINIGAALVLAAPFLFLMQRELGHSLLGRTVKTFDLLWLGEMFYKYRDLAAALAGWVAVPLLLYLVLSVFINGGILGRLVDIEGRTTLRAFSGDCGKYFWRLVGAFLLSLPFLFLAFAVLLKILSEALELLEAGARTEWTLLVVSNLEFLVALFLLSLIRMFFDYVKIILVAEDEPNVFRAVGRAFGFVKTRIPGAWFLYLLVVLVFLGGTVFHFRTTGLVPGRGLLGLAAGLLWAQAYVVFRLWTKLLFFASASRYYSAGSAGGP